MAISERKKRETEALRQRVLDVAEEIFVREGESRVTMRRIAARVDYAPTVLYRLFANRTDLMEHLIARGYEGVRIRYDEVLGRPGLGPLELLDGLLHAYVTYALDHPNHYRMWFDTGRIRREKRSLKMSHGQLDFVVFRAWLDPIRACRKDGLFPGTPPLEAFQILWARVHGVISLRLQHPDFPWLPVARHLERALDLQSLAAG